MSEVIIRDDLEAMAESGLLSDYNRRRLTAARPTDGAMLALNINLTAICNLGCTYCFAKGGDYGRITGKLNEGADVESILQFVKQNAARGETVRFEFFGGEPMINFSTIEALCWRSEALGAEQGIRFLYRISTNLTMRLTERELELFARFRFTVSVSIDGSEATHDRNRPNKAGRGSFRAILDNCYKVRERSDDITLVARMTYVPHPDSSLVADVEALYAFNIFDWFQILPATVSRELVRTVFADAFGDLAYSEICRLCADKVDSEYKLLGEIYMLLFRPGNRFRGVLEIETVIRMLLEGEVANGHCSGGRNYFTFSPDHSIMPCHRLVGEAEFRVGAFGGTIDGEAVAPWRLGINDTPVCRDCAIRYICGGGCKQENFVATADINRPDPEKCRFQFRLVHCAIQAIAESDAAFRARRRGVLRDLFVSCGRPTLSSGRSEEVPAPDRLTHLIPLLHAFD
ncbi:SPASM domain-containing protein [Mesorhizobium sp. M0184]|uniref:radical SAM/SPASM domain-containing protein n=1 Tax=Mesorhizobium sp. M0184 TaxID=2956906 RepID=UPI00333CCAAE